MTDRVEALRADIERGPAALAGLLSFLSPCILPIVPFYLCYLAGLSFSELTGGENAAPTAAVRRKAAAARSAAPSPTAAE